MRCLQVFLLTLGLMRGVSPAAFWSLSLKSAQEMVSVNHAASDKDACEGHQCLADRERLLVSRKERRAASASWQSICSAL